MNDTTTAFETDELRWQAVQFHDPSADDLFVYAVRTTGVYCRPSCRSRRPNLENVRFFDDLEAAERAGFRACRRCLPNQAKVEDEWASVIAWACSRIERSDEFPSQSELAEAAGMTPTGFHRLFVKVVGMSLKRFQAGVRADRLRRSLEAGQPIAGAILNAGFGSVGRGYEASGEALGMTPAQYRNQGEGQSIRYATTGTSLGPLLVASTERGICSISLGDSAEALVERLKKRFPKAELADDAEFRATLGCVVSLIERPGERFDLPLDIRGTAFQRQVWEALRLIPRGTTLTYAELATLIGRPSSVRAVANACGANELAVVIPCHRIVRTNGGLGGYRWGIERKRALLEVESRGEVEEATTPKPTLTPP